MSQRWSRFGSLLAETKRRNVFKVAGAYAMTAWGASLGAAELLPALGAPSWAVPAFVSAAFLGLPVAVALAWVYEITPKGLVRDPAPEQSPTDSGRSAVAASTTVFFGSRGVVHVAWQEAGIAHEKSFATDFRLGRDTACEIVFDDPMVSRRHSAVTYSDGAWWISDLGSRNGTSVDGELVTRARLPARCSVRLYEAGPPLIFEVRSNRNRPPAPSA
jgi:hypothetical protein